ncbi:protein kinase [Streptomyces mexicanus]|uniref:protein kinase n=2 Tax=Streptomyces mexicanus TaxID=178566 RepID=UPI0036B7CEF5
MDDYAGRVLADRYRLPLPPSDEYEPTETRAFDTYSGQEVLLRQIPLPEVVEAEVLDADGLPDGLPEGFTARDGASWRLPSRAQGGAGAPGRRGAATRRPADPAVRRAVEAAQAAARIPDHPRLDQVFDVFAEGGSLWIASELVAARPLAALLAERPLTPYRAAEVASDLLMALRVLHGHGWVHRNITARTVLVCDDGRVMLTGLATGAAEEALCGYDPVPDEDGEAGPQDGGGPPGGIERASGTGGDGGTGIGPHLGSDSGPFPDTGADTGTGAGAGLVGPAAGPAAAAADPEAARRAAIEARHAAGALPLPGSRTDDGPGTFGGTAPHSGGDVRAARAGAIAAYRAGARAAARVQAAQRAAHTALPGARPPAEEETRLVPPGRIADPYGVLGTPGQGRSALPADGSGAGPLQSAPPPGSAAGGGPGAPAPGAGPAPARGLPAPGAVPPQGAATDHGTAEHPDPGIAPHHGPASHHGPVAAQGAAPHQGSAATQRAVPAPARSGGPAGGPAPRGPVTALDAERARQARMTVVGPVTERWAPEQAGPVHANWQLAAPIGPATDLWALGALLFRAVQGHAPYPEESTAELVQMVCAEPPAFAEECGPLRPVVESLLRQDPTERPDVEELAGWLRSLVRSAPEPEAGAHVVSAPPPEETARLPVVRRRGELVRRRRAQLPAHHGRHKRSGRSPRSLGRVLLLLILLLLAGAVAYAMLFMPKAGHEGAAGGDRTRSAGEASPAPASSGDGEGEGADGGAPAPGRSAPGDGNTPDRSAGSTRSTGSAQTQTTGPDLAHGFALREDPAGFQVAVPKSWTRTPPNGQGQVVYSHGDFELIVVPGRDSAAEFGSDPMAYQREKESELRAYRDSSWATSSGLRTIQVGGTTMAEGQFTWNDTGGRELFVRNVAILLDGRYHVVQVRGPETQRDEVNTLYEQASATYRFTG